MPRRSDMHRGRITDYSAQDMRDPVQLRAAMDDYIGKSGLYDRATRRNLVKLVAATAERTIAANDSASPTAGSPTSARTHTGGRVSPLDFSRYVKTD